MRKPIEKRIWSKVNKTNACWLWIGSKSNGYGKINSGGATGKPLRAHRVVYELLVGMIPDGKVIDHICRNRDCVNPKHMEVVTQRENVKRGNLCPKNNKCRRGHVQEGKNIYHRKDRPGKWNCLACAYLLRRNKKL